jgi:hypothetical protein
MSYPAPLGPVEMSDVLEGIARFPDWEFIMLFNQDEGRPADHVHVRHRTSGEVNVLHYELVGDADGTAVYALVMQAVMP